MASGQGKTANVYDQIKDWHDRVIWLETRALCKSPGSYAGREKVHKPLLADPVQPGRPEWVAATM
jgi:hypothetical protein